MHLAEEIKGMGSGTTFAEVSKKVMTTVPLVVAPLAEQERIVAAIEEAFSLLEAGETALHSTHTRLKRMRDSVLTAAVTGQLVPQDPTDTPATQYLHEQGVVSDGPTGGLPEGWTAAAVGDLATVGTGSTPSRSTRRYWEDGSIPWVTSGLLNDGHVIAATEFVSDVALAETSLRLWPPGTLLMAMYGEGKTRGKCAELRIKATCNQACAAISLHEQLESLREYLHLFLDANYLVTRRLAAGGVQPNLNLGLVRALRVSVPPPEEQVRIVVEVERQFSFIEAAERAVDAALARSAGLRRSVLKAAFEGRLVEQDPADEPASVLLERIAAERAVAAPRKRVPGRARGKVVAS
jgi:type I restriction enzyme S subunit